MASTFFNHLEGIRDIGLFKGTLDENDIVGIILNQQD
jgi:hypothetical protein